MPSKCCVAGLRRAPVGSGASCSLRYRLISGMHARVRPIRDVAGCPVHGVVSLLSLIELLLRSDQDSTFRHSRPSAAPAAEKTKVCTRS